MTKEICAQRIYGRRWETFTSSRRNTIMQAIAWCMEHASDLADDSVIYPSSSDYVAALKALLPGVSGLKWGDIMAQTRRSDITRWREIVSCLLRYQTGLRLTDIARLMGRHYSSVIHSVNVCNDRCRYDREFNADLNKLKNEISTKLNKN